MKAATTAAMLAAVLAAWTQAAQQDPFYEILSSSPDTFRANFCLTAPQDLYGWKIKVTFDRPVTAMQIRRADVRRQRSNSTLYHVGDQTWNARWLTGERNCFDFQGTAPGQQTGALATTLRFSGIVEPTGCAKQITDQQFVIDVTRHWRNGISGSFCLSAPRDFNGDWKIRMEFDESLLRLTTLIADAVNVNDRKHWLLTPTSDTGKLASGEQLCLDFTAFTRRMTNPCIRAFFAHDDGLTPIYASGSSSTPGDTASPATQLPSTQSRTTQLPTTQSRTTQLPATQVPTTQSTTTQSSTTQLPTTRSTTTQLPTTQSTTTQRITTQKPTTLEVTTQTPGVPAAGWGGTYTELSLWDAGVYGRLCLDHSAPLTCGWEVDIRFDPTVDRLDIWKAQTLGMTADGSTNIYHLVNFTWNGELSENPVCFLFNAYKSYTHGPQVDGRFTRICSNGVWDDVTGGSGVTSGPRTTASASSPPVSNIPTTTTTTISTTTVAQGNTPVTTGRVNQDMLDLYFSTYSGDGTYYGEGREGTCTYDQTDFPAVGLSNQIHALAALNYIKWYNSKACGMCFKVTGQGVGAGADPLDGEYIVFIKDLCPQGACSLPGSVDFAENKDGRWDISIQAVQCPVGDNKLQYAFQGSNPWYLKLQVSNYRIPPNEVSIKRNGVWKAMTKSSDGYWVLSDGVEMTNTNDIPVLVTAINGEQLSDTVPQLVNGVVMDGRQGVQFSYDPSLPSLSAPLPTTATTATTTTASGPSPTTGSFPPPVIFTGNANQDMLDLYFSSYNGDGTYYGEGRAGTCTYDQTDFPAVGLSNQIHALAALNYIKWYNSKACGMCFRVTGQGIGAGADPLDGEYIVFIKDLCPQGACSLPGSVDFAENKDGRWDISIQAVQCPVGDNKLQYAFQGSNPWYLKLQVSNYRIPPNEVSIKRNGVWTAMTKSSDGYWVLSDGVEMTNTNDIPVWVTAINGEQLSDTVPQLVNGVVMDGGQGVQFSLDPSLPSLP